MSPLNWQARGGSRVLYGPGADLFARIAHIYCPLDNAWAFRVFLRGVSGEHNFVSPVEAEQFVEATYLLTFGDQS